MSEDKDVVFIANLAGQEDLLLGYDTATQVRDGEIVSITPVNAHSIPYRKIDGVITTIGDVMDEFFRAQNQGGN